MNIQGSTGDEESTVGDIRRVVQEELAARESTGAFDPRLAREGVREGYTRRFVGGSESFAYIAIPEIPMKTGVRGFCGDSTARICFTRDGSAPPVVDGRCPGSDQPDPHQDRTNSRHPRRTATRMQPDDLRTLAAGRGW